MSASTSIQPLYTPHERQQQAPQLGAPLLAVILASVALPGLLAYSLATGNEFQVLAVVIAALTVAIVLGQPFWGLILFLGLVYTRPEESAKALNGMRLPLILALLTLVGMWFTIFSRGQKLVRSPQVGML